LVKELSNLVDISKEIKVLLPDGGIILLIGNLASGKTTLVKNFVEYLGLKDKATSPTFSILNIYDDLVFHYDIYNEGSDKFFESGLLENLELDGYHFVEWADEKLESVLKASGLGFVKVNITPHENKRAYRISHEA
jgi:tRNA threonylcarbamoyladenosine biosynthesis protein TsaE